MLDKSQDQSQFSDLRVTTPETWQIVADTILKSKAKVILLKGNLGAGKTTFTKYLAKTLGSQNEVTSPTFSIVNSYLAGETTIYHMDLYRLESYDELFNAGIEEYFFEKNAICIVEWPDLILDTDLAENAVQVVIEVDEEVRKVRVAWV